MRLSTRTGQKGRTDSSASGGSREVDPRGIWTLPHEDNQLCRESQTRLCLHQLLDQGRRLSPLCIRARLWGLRGADYSAVSWTLECFLPFHTKPDYRLSCLGQTKTSWNNKQLCCSNLNWRTSWQSTLPLDFYLSHLFVWLIDRNDWAVCRGTGIISSLFSSLSFCFPHFAFLFFPFFEGFWKNPVILWNQLCLL